MYKTISVAIIEDNSGIRITLEQNINNSNPLKYIYPTKDQNDLSEEYYKFLCIGSYANAEIAEKDLRFKDVDIIIVDLSLPSKMQGVDFIKKDKMNFPKRRYLIYTQNNDDDTVKKAKKVDFDGFLLKTTKEEEIPYELLKVHKGIFPINPDVNRRMIKDFMPCEKCLNLLTDSEKKILMLLCENNSNYEIGQFLYISAENTVPKHLNSIFDKILGANKKEFRDKRSAVKKKCCR